MRRIILVALVVGAALLAANWLSSRDGRRAMILAEARLAPSGGTVILGDSIVERSTVSRDCKALNAGVGSTTVAETLAFAPEVLRAANPARVLLAIGVNDAKRDVRTPLPEFGQTYDRLLSLLGNRLVAIVAVNPIEPGKMNSNRIDPQGIAAENAIIAQLAKKRGVPVIPAPVDVVGATSDGVHPNATGKAAWIQRLGSYCDVKH